MYGQTFICVKFASKWPYVFGIPHLIQQDFYFTLIQIWYEWWKNNYEPEIIVQKAQIILRYKENKGKEE